MSYFKHSFVLSSMVIITDVENTHVAKESIDLNIISYQALVDIEP